MTFTRDRRDWSGRGRIGAGLGRGQVGAGSGQGRGRVGAGSGRVGQGRAGWIEAGSGLADCNQNFPRISF